MSFRLGARSLARSRNRKIWVGMKGLWVISTHLGLLWLWLWKKLSKWLNEKKSFSRSSKALFGLDRDEPWDLVPNPPATRNGKSFSFLHAMPSCSQSCTSYCIINSVESICSTHAGLWLLYMILLWSGKLISQAISPGPHLHTTSSNSKNYANKDPSDMQQ